MVDLTNLDTQLADSLRKKVAAEAWRRGRLEYKLQDTHKKILEAIDKSTRRQFFVLCSRRFGKTTLLLIKLFSYAIQNPGSRLLFVAPHQKNAREIASDLAVKILADCPEELRPEFNGTTLEYKFTRDNQPPSIIRLKGVNGEASENLRGGEAHLIVLDECQSITNLREVINSICLPMTLVSDGRIILVGTPSPTPGHDSQAIFESLAQDDSTATFDIRDMTHVSLGRRAEYLVEAGEESEEVFDILAGRKDARTSYVQREYFCNWVSDANTLVIPEYTRLHREILLDHPRPECFVPYVSLDPGVIDNSGVLFGYFDFLKQRLIIEDELLLKHPSTIDLATAIMAKEKELWGILSPKRFLDSSGDGGLRLIADLNAQFNMKFTPARKDNSMAAISLLRNSVQTRELVINPRCKHLDRQLRNATWNTKGTDMVRSEADRHFDLVSSLKYLCRSVDRKSNPYPEHYRAVGGKLGPPLGTFFPRGQKKKSLGLFPDTPMGRKIAASRSKKR